MLDCPDEDESEDNRASRRIAFIEQLLNSDAVLATTFERCEQLSLLITQFRNDVEFLDANCSEQRTIEILEAIQVMAQAMHLYGKHHVLGEDINKQVALLQLEAEWKARLWLRQFRPGLVNE